MNVFEMGELGKFIRKKRKEQGLRLEDLADQHISTATISNIERGVTHVNKEKIIYLLNQLKLDINEIPQMILADNENQETIQLKFIAIETMLYLKKNKQAVRFLSSLSSTPVASHQAMTCMLKGKYHINQQDWEKAEQEFSKAVRLAGKDRHAKKTNLIANCYDQLAICRFAQADIGHALLFIERGIGALQPDAGDYQRLKNRLQIHRVEYLEKKGKTGEALKRLDELWKGFDTIQDTSMILHMYILQAKLLRQVKLNQDVIASARKGIQLAMGSHYYHEMFQLWMILGKTYVDLYQLEDAETCFQFVQELEVHVQDREALIHAYCSLSYVYLLQDKLSEAEKAVKQAINISAAEPERIQPAYVWVLCGLIKRNQGEWLEAIEDYRQAIAIAEKTDHAETSLQAHLELAECYHHLQQEDQFIKTVSKTYQLQKALQKDKWLSQW